MENWYKGPTLVEAIDSFEPVAKVIDGPLRLPITDLYKSHAGMAVSGRIESGKLSLT
jgi:translation elongation factor EF-1alpha